MRKLGTIIGVAAIGVVGLFVVLVLIGRHVTGDLFSASDGWSYDEPVDKVTGKTTYQATREIALDGGGTAQMTAECHTDTALSGGFGSWTFMRIRIAFFDKDDKPVGIDNAGMGDEMGEGKWGFFRGSYKDGGEDKFIFEELHANEAGIVAASDDAPGIAGLGMILVGINPMNAAIFANAPFARLEAPLMNDTKPVIDLKPQDPELRKVLARCVPSVVKPPAPPKPAQSASGRSAGDRSATNNGPTNASAPANPAASSAPNPPPSGSPAETVVLDKPSNAKCDAAPAAALDYERAQISAHNTNLLDRNSIGIAIRDAPARETPDTLGCPFGYLEAGASGRVILITGDGWAKVAIAGKTGDPAEFFVWSGLIRPADASGESNSGGPAVPAPY